MGRWAARTHRTADRRDEHYRQHQEAVRAGRQPPGPGDRFSASWQQLAEADNSYFQRCCQVIQLLTSGPVSGPDGIPVLICLAESSVRYLLISRPPKLPMPGPWLRAIAMERTLTGQAARIKMTGCTPRFAYAYAMSGPPLQVRRRFRYSADALTYVLGLAEDVRSRGVQVLR
jgi:hypothetical protein